MLLRLIQISNNSRTHFYHIWEHSSIYRSGIRKLHLAVTTNKNLYIMLWLYYVRKTIICKKKRKQ